MARTVTPEAFAMVQQLEGVRLTSYEDPLVPGLWTVGYGHCGPEVKPGMTINATDAALFLKNDLAKAGDAVERLVPGLGQYAYDALCSFTMNLGEGALAESTLRRRINAGEDPYVVLAEELPKWCKASGKPVPGLVKRRQLEVLHAQKDGPRKTGSAPAHVTAHVISLENFFKHYQALPHQVQGVKLLEKALLRDAPDLLDSDAEWIEAFRDRGSTYVQLPVPYQYQLDSATRHGYRMCFSSTNAMAVEFLRPGTLKGAQADDAYLRVVLEHGDTTSAEAQVAALKEFGVRAAFRQDGSSKRAKELLSAGLPVPVGILHHGPWQNPQGDGHWLLLVGFDEDRAEWICHDPNGRLEPGGGYRDQSPTAGRFVRYPFQQLNKRWMVAGEGDGWYLELQR